MPDNRDAKLLQVLCREVREDCLVMAPSAVAGATSVAPSVPPEDRAERRQVTVMFADLVRPCQDLCR